MPSPQEQGRAQSRSALEVLNSLTDVLAEKVPVFDLREHLRRQLLDPLERYGLGDVGVEVHEIFPHIVLQREDTAKEQEESPFVSSDSIFFKGRDLTPYLRGPVSRRAIAAIVNKASPQETIAESIWVSAIWPERPIKEGKKLLPAQINNSLEPTLRKLNLRIVSVPVDPEAGRLETHFYLDEIPEVSEGLAHPEELPEQHGHLVKGQKKLKEGELTADSEKKSRDFTDGQEKCAYEFAAINPDRTGFKHHSFLEVGLAIHPKKALSEDKKERKRQTQVLIMSVLLYRRAIVEKLRLNPSQPRIKKFLEWVMQQPEYARPTVEETISDLILVINMGIFFHELKSKAESINILEGSKSESQTSGLDGEATSSSAAADSQLLSLGVGAEGGARETDGDYSAKEEQFLVWYSKYERFIFNLVRRWVNGDTELSEDIVAQTFLNVWKARDRFDSERPEPVKSWLIKIARNTMMHTSRRNGKTARLPEDFDIADVNGVDPEQAVVDALVIKELKDTIETLPFHYKEVLKLRLKDLTFREIGERLGLPENTVKTHAFRGVRELRKRLASLKGEFVGESVVFTDGQTAPEAPSFELPQDEELFVLACALVSGAGRKVLEKTTGGYLSRSEWVRLKRVVEEKKDKVTITGEDLEGLVLQVASKLSSYQVQIPEMIAYFGKDDDGVFVFSVFFNQLVNGKNPEDLFLEIIDKMNPTKQDKGRDDLESFGKNQD